MNNTENLWKTVLTDELWNCWIANEENLNDPRKALRDVLDFNIQLALDPGVSEAARNLLFTRPRLGDDLVGKIWYDLNIPGLSEYMVFKVVRECEKYWKSNEDVHSRS